MAEAADFTWPGRRPGYPAHDVIMDFLGADIQVNPAAAAALVARIEAIERGSEAEWRRIGNLYDLHLSAERARIVNIYEEDRSSEASFHDFAVAARAWRDYVGR